MASFILFASCVSTNSFKQVAGEEQIFHDTLKNAIQKCEMQQQVIDNLETQMKQERDTYLSTIDSLQNSVDSSKAELALHEARLKNLNEIVGLQQQAVYNLKQQVCDALKCFTPQELNVEVKNGKLYVSLSDELLFPSASDKVDKRGKEAITQLAKVLANSDMEIMVEGHTDAVPINNTRNKDNWDLSAHRATSVVRLFEKNGIDAERLIPAGRSKYLPVSDNDSKTGRQMNRRTEIVLAPNLDKLWELTETENINITSKKLSNLNNPYYEK